MLEDSYDGQGMKFGILVSNQFEENNKRYYGKNSTETTDEVEKILQDDNSKIVDFSYAEGLTIDEILSFNNLHPNIYPNKSIIFVSYRLTPYGHRFYRIIDFYGVIEKKEENKDTLIEKEIENIILNDYDKMPQEIKRKMLCFLQRYRYGTKERTDEVIKQKVLKKEQ